MQSSVARKAFATFLKVGAIAPSYFPLATLLIAAMPVIALRFDPVLML